ncbi:hypothetical protein GGX14DRAFT_609302 [Mycena pura]|uniref:TNT domain-containing protein n=1 Tax=Mycena pura TaxID=153505 RepID=A0AAD6UM53_9AGAR|nr:hypothetical protein GGX14DRAFT_609302 [Mycena pura]
MLSFSHLSVVACWVLLWLPTVKPRLLIEPADRRLRMQRHRILQQLGVLLDYFGFEGGSFLAPAFTPYGQRSLPPSSLNTPDGRVMRTANYFVYRVLNKFIVLTGTTAPWFEQPGQQRQHLALIAIRILIPASTTTRLELNSYVFFQSSAASTIITGDYFEGSPLLLVQVGTRGKPYQVHLAKI